MKMGIDDRRARAGHDIDSFKFESRPLTTPGFDLMSRRPMGSSLRSRYPNLVHLIEDSPAKARTPGRIEGPGRGIGQVSAMPPRPILLHHTCEGGECDLKRKDYFGPRLAEQVNNENPVTNEPAPEDNDEPDSDN